MSFNMYGKLVKLVVLLRRNFRFEWHIFDNIQKSTVFALSLDFELGNLTFIRDLKEAMMLLRIHEVENIR